MEKKKYHVPSMVIVEMNSPLLLTGSVSELSDEPDEIDLSDLLFGGEGL